MKVVWTGGLINHSGSKPTDVDSVTVLGAARFNRYCGSTRAWSRALRPVRPRPTRAAPSGAGLACMTCCAWLVMSRPFNYGRIEGE